MSGLAGRRIVVMIRFFEFAGAERQAALLAKALHDAGAEVLVWSINDGHAVPEQLDAWGIRHHAQSPGTGGGAVRRVLDLLRFIRHLRAFRPDILLPFTDLPNKICGAIWPLTGAGSCIWNQRDEGREVTGRPIERLALRLVPGFAANSEAGREFLEREFNIDRTRTTLINNGVQLAAAREDRHAWRTRIGVGESSAVATMIANLHHFKDHATLLRAWPAVLDRHPDAVLVLAGNPGPTSATINDIVTELDIGNSVRLPGYVDDVSGLLAASDLAVFSSSREGCPNGVLEPMAAGLPVVATDIIGIREALGGDCPWLVPEKDPKAFAAAVLEALGDNGRRRREGEANLRRIEEHFSPEATLEAWKALILRMS